MKHGSTAMIMASLALAACGKSDNRGTGNGAAAQVGETAPAPAAGPAQTAPDIGQVHSGSGDITEISGDSVTISHGPIPSAGFPATTMAFRAQDPAIIQGLAVGDPVDFQFRQDGGSYALTSITKVRP